MWKYRWMASMAQPLLRLICLAPYVTSVNMPAARAAMKSDTEPGSASSAFLYPHELLRSSAALPTVAPMIGLGHLRRARDQAHCRSDNVILKHS
jgi:hypothetical protein